MYYKNIFNGYIESVSTGSGQTSITVEEYNALLDIIHTHPDAHEGYIYMLRADTLTWELVKLPPVPEPEPEEATIEDYQSALGELGVTV